MAVSTVTAAVRAIDAVIGMLEDAGIDATRDGGAFYPQPAGVLVSLPTLAARGAGFRTFELPVLCVSGDPLNAVHVVDRLYALADACALALATDNYRPSSWRSSGHAEPLPALELTVTVTVAESEA